MLSRDEDILKAAEDWRKLGRGVALATVVETWGSAPRPVGSNLVIDNEGNFLGSVSGGCVEGAVVLLITDGLERDADDTLSFEMDRLHRSCRRLIWLNPLLRFDGFEARAKGVRIMLPHVDELRPIHNLESMSELVRALSGASAKDYDPKQWLRHVA